MKNLKKLMLLMVMFAFSFVAKAQETTSEIQGNVLAGKEVITGNRTSYPSTNRNEVHNKYSCRWKIQPTKP
jgi:hypothetical protein